MKTPSQKQILAKKYVEIFSEITNVPKDRVYIFFDGHELNNVGTAGIRFSDKPSKAWSKFTEDEWSKNPEIVAGDAYKLYPATERDDLRRLF